MSNALANKWIGLFIGAIILAALVGATGGTLLTNLTTLNGTFASTGLGTLFGATIIGLLLVVFVFMAFWKMFKHS